MSDAQQATPEQEAQAQAFLDQARQQAMQEVQQNMQIEIQMRLNALSAAVTLYEGGSGEAAEEIAKTATTFLKFLKQGEVSNV